MNYYQRVKLKDGAGCVIRSAEGTDAKAVYENFQLTHGQTDYLLSYPDENSFDIQQEGQFLRKKKSSDREVELCAVVGGKLVGTAGIEAIGVKEKVRHRAEFGISVEKAHWGRGIGHLLTLACLDCAKAAGYWQVELNVVGTNEAAIQLYRKVGFQEYGRNPCGFRTRDGQWQELVLMRLELQE